MASSGMNTSLEREPDAGSDSDSYIAAIQDEYEGIRLNTTPFSGDWWRMRGIGLRRRKRFSDNFLFVELKVEEFEEALWFHWFVQKRRLGGFCVPILILETTSCVEYTEYLCRFVGLNCIGDFVMMAPVDAHREAGLAEIGWREFQRYRGGVSKAHQAIQQAGNLCVASFDWSCSGICKSVERMKVVHNSCGEGDEAVLNVDL